MPMHYVSKSFNSELKKSYLLMRRLAHHAVYNIFTTWIIVLSNIMNIDIIFLHIWHTISSIKFVFKRGQGRLPYILLLLGNMSYVIYQKSNRITVNR